MTQPRHINKLEDLLSEDFTSVSQKFESWYAWREWHDRDPITVMSFCKKAFYAGYNLTRAEGKVAPEPPEELSFTQWLAMQGVRDDIVGDLAWDLANLPERRPVNDSYLAWDTFVDRSPVDLRDAFRKAWLEYEEYCGDCEGD